MRKLTKKEIDDAPSWAVSYLVTKERIGSGVSYHERHYGFTLPLPSATPQRKEFDIIDEWHNSTYKILDNGSVELIDDPTLDRGQVITLAKHFKLTAEDLI
jgi:hypothetical protein